MRLAWIAGLLLMVHQMNTPDNLTISHQGQTVAIVNRADLTTPLFGVPIIDENKYNQFIETLNQKIYHKPVNAVLNDHGGIVPGEAGYKLYRKKFREEFTSYLYANGSKKLDVPLLPINPKVDSELLSHIRIQKIGQYVTYFNKNNKNRTHNIILAVDAINNSVVFPGEKFSFNQVVGKRTESKGYMRAPVIVKGEMAEDIGGGICQVSSTLFNAIDSAGVQITQRYSHSKKVPYVPPGRDATVSWYGPDFSFKNIYNQPILIRAKTIGGMVVIGIYSSDVINYKPRKISSQN
ncbi:VanW family protein [Bacillus gobiensis]|uniref:VanW family protein n=1 Tax=Bacillus gobiensis TaxID=1441095 RepID=UPI003D261982